MSGVARATTEWQPWLNFLPSNRMQNCVECVYCKKQFSYVRERAFMHFGWGAKPSTKVCSKMPRAVRAKFQNCAAKVPGRMLDEEVFSGPSSNSGVQVSCSSQSTHDESLAASHNESIYGIDVSIKSTVERNRTASSPIFR